MVPVIGYIVTTIHRIDYLTIQLFNAAKPVFAFTAASTSLRTSSGFRSLSRTS